MKSSKQYPGAIHVYDNVWEDPQSTIDLIESECSTSSMYWETAGVNDRHFGSNIDNSYQGISERTNLHTGLTYFAEKGNRTAQQLHNRFCNLLIDAAESYMYEHRLLGITPYSHEFYSVLKYSDNQKFDAHVDGMPGSNRFISCILYLNDNYIGGELEFINYDLKLKMPAGSLVIFPSGFSHAHQAHPVTSGTKYAIVTWLYYLNQDTK